MANINDNKNIIDTEKLLLEKEKEYHGTDKFLGMTTLTQTGYISSSRSIMFTNHLKQYVVLNNPEFARVFTNYENSFGRLSSSIHKADANYEVVKRISKYADKPDHMYALFVYNKETDTYDVIMKKIVEELTEKYGYEFNNKKLDSLKPGDTIRKDETIWKSTSYDDDDNYCYGVNAMVCYLIDTATIEDAVVVSKQFADRMISKKVETVNISINDNDVLCNLYGDKDVYKGFPDIGEEVRDSILCSKRRIINDQILYDMKKANLFKTSLTNDKPYYSNGTVVDIDIYCNKTLEEIGDAEYNQQFIRYLKNQERYYTEIKEFTEKIINSGSKYSDDIGFLYQRSSNILDPNYRWKDQDTVFNYIVMDITVAQNVGLSAGYKLTGRYGNKGVISFVADIDENGDSHMPYFYQADGTKKYVDVVLNSLGVVNRLNSAQIYEVSINFISDNLVQKFKTMDNNEEKAKMLFKYLSYFNESGYCDELKEYYYGLSEEGRKDFFADIDKYGIYVNVPPIWESQPMFDKLTEIYKEFDWIKPYQAYVHQFGREIPILNPLIIGEEYLIKLKQTSKKNFSARGTGHLSQIGLPDKTSKLKNNQQLWSTNPIKMGRDEDSNLGIGVLSDMIAKFHLFYRSSPKARRSLKKLYTANILNFKKFKIKRGYRNRNAEVLMAYLKAMGYRINFGRKTDMYIEGPDDGIKKDWYFKGHTYIMTEKEFREFLLDQKLRKMFSDKNLNLFNECSDKEVEEIYQEYKRDFLETLQGQTVLNFGKRYND